MACAFDAVIAAIVEQNGGKKDDIIREFEGKRSEYLTASASEVIEAFGKFLDDRLAELKAQGSSSSHSSSSSSDIVVSRADQQCMRQGMDAVVKFLDDNNWHYDTKELRPDVMLYKLDITSRNKVKVTMKVYVEADPNLCRIVAVCPFTAEAAYAYPVCKEMAKENYSKRFGAFNYDERDGEITFEYAFLINNGLHQDDLDTYFNAVFSTAARSSEGIRKCCNGAFKSQDIKDILEQVNELVDKLGD